MEVAGGIFEEKSKMLVVIAVRRGGKVCTCVSQDGAGVQVAAGHTIVTPC